MLALSKLEEREAVSPRCGMDVCLFYSIAESSVVGENSRFEVHPSREAVTEMLVKGEFLA